MYDLSKPWNSGVQGEQILPLINEDCDVLRVEAGPGTGKTFGLRKRVLRILHPDGLACESSEVLVCAFNRVISKDLADEIQKELSPHGLALPKIKTIHGFCAEIAGFSGTILLPQEVEAMLYDVRMDHPEIAENLPRITAIRKALEEHQAGHADHQALRSYVDQWLTNHRATLVGDLPRNFQRGMQQGDYLQYRYQHVIVDEFQDLTETEAKIAVGLVKVGGNLVVLGDQKQSIYHFRGNARGGLDNIERMVTAIVTEHTMDECRRCPDAIVRLSNAIVAHYGLPLTATGEREGQIHSIHFKTPESEAKGLAKEIVRVYKLRPTEKHLVMVTRRKWGYDLRKEISDIDSSIPVKTVFSEDALQTWPARKALMKLSVLSGFNPAITLRDWLSYQEPDASGKFQISERNAPGYSTVKSAVGMLDYAKVDDLLQHPGKLSGRGKKRVLVRLQELKDFLDEFNGIDDAEEILTRIFDPETATGADNESIAREDITRLKNEAIQELEDIIETGRDALKKVVNRLRHSIALREPLGQEDGGMQGIKIVTLHGAKGLTADFVYIMGLVDEAIPGFSEESAGQEPGEYLEEQRRLFYVSLTRAKQAMVLSRADRIHVGELSALKLRTPARSSRYWASLSVCSFVKDIPTGLLPNAEVGEEWLGIQL